MIEGLGPWGPVVFCVSLLVLEPFLVPDTLFALAAGAAFGVVAGTAYYFAAVYVMCLGVQWLGRHWLKARVLRLLGARHTLRAMVLSAPKGGVRFTFLVRLVPVNPALLSYGLGAAGVPLRAAVVGNLGMFTHMLPTVYFGAAAMHVTRMAGRGHKEWELEGLLLMLGLAVCAALALQITRRAWAAIGAETGSELAAPQPDP
jgi:uncharacterized membrane protein YdjX (TVP38/TMEM64 family)